MNELYSTTYNKVSSDRELHAIRREEVGAKDAGGRNRWMIVEPNVYTVTHAECQVGCTDTYAKAKPPLAI
jgi:hypothetical protein